MSNYLRIGPVSIRFRSKMLAPWGFPRVAIGGLSIWSRTSGGDPMLLAYHPRRSTTWHWSVIITRRGRGYAPIWSREERERMAALHEAGNPYVGAPKWWHRFYWPDTRRRGQWHDYIRLPFGFSIVIGRQDYHRQDATP